MNPTLKRFKYPNALIAEYEQWAVLIRPAQPTPLSCVIAARADVNSLGELSAAAGAELPRIIGAYEAAVRGIASALKFNYLALMMVDPNPHFHAIPRYANEVRLGGVVYGDKDFPKPIDISRDLGVDAATLDQWRAMLAAHWKR